MKNIKQKIREILDRAYSTYGNQNDFDIDSALEELVKLFKKRGKIK